MNLAATFQAHRTPILAASAGLVGLLAYTRRKSAGPSSSAGVPATMTAGSTGGAAYDSSASDVYNALQPQIEQTQGMLSQLTELITGGGVKAPTPAPAPGPTRIPTPVAHVMTPPRKPRTKHPKGAVLPPKRSAYTVRKGDSLSKIGARYGVSWGSIYSLNRGVIGANANLIRPGQRLVIPK